MALWLEFAAEGAAMEVRGAEAAGLEEEFEDGFCWEPRLLSLFGNMARKGKVPPKVLPCESWLQSAGEAASQSRPVKPDRAYFRLKQLSILAGPHISLLYSMRNQQGSRTSVSLM